MSKIEVDAITQQSGTTLTVGGGACKTATVDATTVTLGRSGGTVQLASGATQSGFGRTGTVDWQTGSIKTGNFTAVNGEGYFVNTTSGAISVTLPASPAAGSIVGIADYAGTSPTNPITILRNSSKIEGGTFDASISTPRETKTLVYVDATQGWVAVNSNDQKLIGSQFICATGGTIVDNGDFRTHIFTGTGTFTVNCVAPGPSGNPNAIDYFVVAGGGGGPGANGGGGGAGGFRLSNCVGSIPAPTMSPLVKSCGAITATATSFPITVGAGGAAGLAPPSTNGTNGSSSTFSTITSAGGGFGGARGVGPKDGGPGGSGGGGGGECAGAAGNGNTPPVSPAQGTNGGAAGGPAPRASGGGGGAACAGGSGAPSQDAGDGGAGSFLADAFIGPTAPSFGTPGPVSSTRYFSGGGGGGVESSPGIPGGFGSNGTGGVGGGGPGGPGPTAGGGGTAGTTNTGGGGGGASRYNCGSAPITNGGAGGSGIVILRYKFQ